LDDIGIASALEAISKINGSLIDMVFYECTVSYGLYSHLLQSQENSTVQQLGSLSFSSHSPFRESNSMTNDDSSESSEEQVVSRAVSNLSQPQNERSDRNESFILRKSIKELEVVSNVELIMFLVTGCYSLNGNAESNSKSIFEIELFKTAMKIEEAKAIQGEEPVEAKLYVDMALTLIGLVESDCRENEESLQVSERTALQFPDATSLSEAQAQACLRKDFNAVELLKEIANSLSNAASGAVEFLTTAVKLVLRGNKQEAILQFEGAKSRIAQKKCLTMCYFCLLEDRKEKDQEIGVLWQMAGNRFRQAAAFWLNCIYGGKLKDEKRNNATEAENDGRLLVIHLHSIRRNKSELKLEQDRIVDQQETSVSGATQKVTILKTNYDSSYIRREETIRIGDGTVKSKKEMAAGHLLLRLNESDDPVVFQKKLEVLHRRNLRLELLNDCMYYLHFGIDDAFPSIQEMNELLSEIGSSFPDTIVEPDFFMSGFDHHPSFPELAESSKCDHLLFS
jgi:hypothetical protein